MKSKQTIAGYLYLLSHPSDKNLFKVGVTRRKALIRLAEHNTQLEKAAGKVVKETGKLWELKEVIKVEDIYLAEHKFWKRSPLTELPYSFGNELVQGMPYQWIEEGLEEAKKAGRRSNPNIPPIPKTTPLRGSVWIKAQLEGTGIEPLKSCGNGTMKAWFSCKKGHVFKIGGFLLVGGYKLIRTPSCPVFYPQTYSKWELESHIEYKEIQ